MIKMDFSWLAAVLKTPYDGENLAVANINTDTRTIQSGEVFLALKGPNFDGHRFLDVAKARGAIAAIVSEHDEDIDLPQFVVADTRIALGQIGRAVIETVAPKTIAITGSVGKTTVKEMCAAILAQKGKVLATKGNFNNDIGVPLTLLRLSEDDEFAVIELGANHLGEIAYTTELVSPDVATVCNVAPAHIEGFGSIDGVGKAKGEIFSGLKADGVAVINADSDYAQMWQESLAVSKVKRYSLNAQLDIWVEAIELDELARPTFTLCQGEERTTISLPLSGQHNVGNALIAAALTTELGASLSEVATGLGQMAEVKGRVNMIQVSDTLRVVDDTYNANVKSVNAAIDLLASMSGYKVLALGDMAELGEDAREYHREVGEYAKQQGIDELFSLGVLSSSASNVFEKPNRHFSTRENLMKALRVVLAEQSGQCTVIVKGSRSARMELLVEELVNAGQSDSETGEVSC
ncbi:UDP-N-acetylmuramoyl-tripeptide--D-alanyl-D-alanine ligase [Pseudoalteromonas sp. OANN1]|uniref:UDP-N-acetylmuramoyl-tripeptide--D-alanyl-D- alanine ligase n=1 Tax=Pseudoalteromonas sp. OANN1 TaxID=2954497 RepID=UPI002096A63E|nr:UDP-N-acetylmuramoyl-tripeptide--D-alanyl-D-alanine ligase [Pseudoalteromonas sp. OANN1]MCO7198190.1 UDP-N-acetylmuramoyl-tripeptide--D-alanyl-D-alanine ligase [Pseudoalteromonas sp. OANN1]